MLLDERSAALLILLQHSPISKMSDLEIQTGLTRRQIQYAIGKANDWLEFNSYSAIQFDRQKGYFLTQPINEEALDVKMTKNTYTFSEKERESLFYLMILLGREELSVYHFQSITGLSRNTVLTDLRRLKKKTQQLDLTLEYSKQKGYVISGNSLAKRYAAEYLVSEVFSNPNSRAIVECIWKDDEQQIKAIKVQLEQIEQKLGVTFTDERLNELSYLFLCADLLIRRGEGLQNDDSWNQLVATDEYRMVEQMAKTSAFQAHWSQTEKQYATLHLLSMNRTKDLSPLKEDETIQVLLQQIVKEFERLAFVHLQDKELLYEQLYIHFKPAYHRLKYGLPQVNPITGRVQKVYPELHHLVRKTLQILERKLGKAVPEDEVAYFTIHFGGWLRRQGTALDDRKRAIVVCPNGVGISNILIYTLRELFPDILFLDVLSVRSAANYQLPYDLVFSTVHMRTDALLFVVPPILEVQEKHVLRQQVMQELYGYTTGNIDVGSFLKIISKYATIHNASELEKALQSNLYSPSRKQTKFSLKEAEKPVLGELLTLQTIQLQPSAASWQQAIQSAAQPLVESGTVEECYVKAMIESIEANGPYVVITPGVAIPHARPEQGVNSLSMSLLKLEEPVEFASDKPVQLIIVLAASDSDSHLRALIQLTQLLNEPANIKRMLEISDKTELMEFIHENSKEETQ
ncbi:BglG family transcription antiterminator [Planococcus sp. 1R117A]|uniref:BglG family transcription antiterminator n=1 Tax=Planococcus sp. 1R117A TaxID=3447020 RepID=UPI003EDCA28E